MVLTLHDDPTAREPQRLFRRREGSGRIAKRRAFALQASWSSLQQVAELQHALSPAPMRRDEATQPSVPGGVATLPIRPMPHTRPAAITCVSCLAASDAHNRRMTLARKHGSGRRTQLRSFTLQLTLPAPPSPSPQPSPMQAPLRSPSPSCLIAPLALATSSPLPTPSDLGPAPGVPARTPGMFAFTPLEGVPERHLTVRRPTHQPSPVPIPPSTAFRLAALTPLEGVPERGGPYALTARRPLRQALGTCHTPGEQVVQMDEDCQHHTGAREGSDGDFLCRAHDSVLKTAAPSPAAGCSPAEAAGDSSAPEPSLRHITAGAGPSNPTTPFAFTIAGAANDPGPRQFREVDVQTGVSLRSSYAAAEAAHAGPSHVEVQEPAEAAGMVDDGSCDDMAGPLGHEQQQHEGVPGQGGEVQAAAEPSCSALPDQVPDQAQAPGGRREGGSIAGDAEGPRQQQQQADGNRKKSMAGRELEAMQRRKSLAGVGLVMDQAQGLRKSTRTHQRPLEYWRNECKEYGRDHQSLPTVVKVETRTPNPCWPRSTPHGKGAAKKKRARTKP